MSPGGRGGGGAAGIGCWGGADGGDEDRRPGSSKTPVPALDPSLVGILTELAGLVRVEDKTIIDKLTTSNRHAHVLKPSHVKAGSKLYKSTNLGVQHSGGHVTYDCENFCHLHKHAAIFNDHRYAPRSRSCTTMMMTCDDDECISP